MNKWKILSLGIVIVLITANGGIASKEKPFLSKDEIKGFLTSLGIDEKTIATMNISDLYLSDIPDDFWSWMNMSKEESAKLIKDIIHQIINNESGALEKLIELFPVERERPILTFGPETLEELKDRSGVIAIYGRIPKLNAQEEKWKWVNKLQEIFNKTGHLIGEKFMKKNKIVPMFATNGEGYLEVYINRKICNDIQKLVREIYSIIDATAKKLGIKEVPVVFFDGSDFKVVLDAGRTDKYRPIRGGIQVTNIKGSDLEISTLGYSARRYFTKGYVICGHLSIEYDTTMYQPLPYEQAGRVKYIGGEWADAAFVAFNNVAPYVYTVPYGYHLGLVAGYYDPWINQQVWMSGIISGWVTGTVYKYANIISPVHGLLYRQAVATYPRALGDSGAPVLDYGREILPGLAFVKILGIHSGSVIINNRLYSYFSPQSGVYTDLHARPLVIG